jgi:hypothetical protein
MNQRLFVFTVLLFLVPVSAAAGEARIALLSLPDWDPPPDAVADVLVEQLASLEVTVDSFDVDAFPASPDQWVDAAILAGRVKPGMIALFGYTCTEAICRLFIVEHRQKTQLEVPVKVPKGKTSSETVRALAATIREALLGPLFPELKRLSLVGEDLLASSSTTEDIWWKLPLEDKQKSMDETRRPALWIDGGYHGETAFHRGGTTGGAWVGAQYEPRKRIGVGLSIGWLGIQEATGPAGTVKTHRLTTLMSASFSFPIGPATISVAPALRFDTVFAQTNPTGSAETTDAEFEIQLGAMAVWHLPIIEDLEAIVGVGLLASVLSHDYGIGSAGPAYDDMIPASVLRLFWIVGVAWSPLGDRL